MCANAQRDGHPAEYRWRPLFNAAKFGWRPMLECRNAAKMRNPLKLECGPMPNVMVALPNIGGALCSTP